MQKSIFPSSQTNVNNICSICEKSGSELHCTICKRNIHSDNCSYSINISNDIENISSLNAISKSEKYILKRSSTYLTPI